MARNIGGRSKRNSGSGKALRRKESISRMRMFLRHSPEHIVGHAARRRIAPDTFPLLECADLPGSGIRRTDAVRAPRRYAPWARPHPTFVPFYRIARAQKSGFTIPDAPLRRSDRMPSSGSVRQTSGQPGHKGGSSEDFFPANLSNSHQSLIGLRGRRSHVFVAVAVRSR